MKTRSNKSIGSIVRYYRLLKGYSQKELADILNVTESAISAWERGISKPAVDIALFFSKEINISIQEFYFETIDEDTHTPYQAHESIVLQRSYVDIQTIEYSDKQSLTMHLRVRGLTVDPEYIQDVLNLEIHTQDHQVNGRHKDIVSTTQFQPQISPDLNVTLFQIPTYEVKYTTQIPITNDFTFYCDDGHVGGKVALNLKFIHSLQAYSYETLMQQLHSNKPPGSDEVTQAIYFKLHRKS